MATLHIIKDPKKYGVELGETYSPPEYETVEISKQAHLKDLAELIDIPREKLRELNPELRYSIVPGGEYRLRVPPQTGDILLSRLENMSENASPDEDEESDSEEPQVQEESPIQEVVSVREESPVREFVPVRSSVRTKNTVKALSLKSRKTVKKEAAVSVGFHKVRRGETVFSIARRYRISVNTVARMNGIGKRSRLLAGKEIKIPGDKMAKASRSEEYGRTKYRPPASKHVVRRGDSLYNIASRYDTTPDALKGLNNIRKAKIRIGQVLKLPVKAAAISSSSKSPKAGISRSSNKKMAKLDLRTYRVRRGDALREIARRHNMDFDRFLRVNHMTQRSKIYPGQKLYVD
jgi:membrane-bound lytic murein transglycosylase D